jgi:hypothetical protein
MMISKISIFRIRNSKGCAREKGRLRFSFPLPYKSSQIKTKGQIAHSSHELNLRVGSPYRYGNHSIGMIPVIFLFGGELLSVYNQQSGVKSYG